MSRVRNRDWIDPDGRLIWVDGVACLGFGKHKGRTVADVLGNDPDYLDWMATADFSEAVRGIVRAARVGVFPTRDEVSRQTSSRFSLGDETDPR